ncbi:ASCH domain-containing protein [Pusillimonas sp. NJUB218]|uniref:ASCH domain-containing protein n=1 Tax=Pusillimonas sp. NJUB218 TaxID=2023230 RepID=UPI000F4BEC51|nr:ASCH domain-containing protein [Pusillimonas sp. NJUB218]ROT45053.1 RNA-binding protein [Pusillimonas sp. NJUB218]
MTDLILPLKREYFEQIKAGEKWFEYRLLNDYWAKRLEGSRVYSRIILTLGYPRRDDFERRIERPWRGFYIRTITHPHFGPEPVQVYAIDVRPE